jgi:hypothetical protein
MAAHVAERTQLAVLSAHDHDLVRTHVTDDA